MNRGIGRHDAPNRRKNKNFGDRSSSAFRRFAVVALLAAGETLESASNDLSCEVSCSSDIQIAIELKQKDIN